MLIRYRSRLILALVVLPLVASVPLLARAWPTPHAGLAAGAKTSVAPKETVAAIDPATQQVPLDGGDFTVNVTVADVSNLGAFEFLLVFDPTVVKFKSITQGAFLGSTGRDIYCPSVIVYSPGTVRYGCASIPHWTGQPGPNGSGVLATVTFSPLQAGASSLDLANTQFTALISPLGDAIKATWENGSVAVGRDIESSGTPSVAITSPRSGPAIDDTGASGFPTPCLLDPSRTGDELASSDSNTGEVRLEDSRGQVTTVVPAGVTKPYTPPALSPSGDRLVLGASFRQGSGTSQEGLWQIELANLGRTLLFPSDNGGSFYFDDPAYSPDGTEIAFTHGNVTLLPTHEREDTYEIWVMHSDGSNPHKVADGRMPLWSSDGRFLSVLPPGSLFSDRVLLDAKSFRPVPKLDLKLCNP